MVQNLQTHHKINQSFVISNFFRIKADVIMSLFIQCYKC